jgi:lysophospholipase L1-like esterase
MRVLVFGDSIVYGRDAVSCGWAQRLLGDDIEQMLEAGAGQGAVFNLGVYGNTTKDVIKRFEAETKARKGTDPDIAFVFSVGLNDAKVVDDKPVSTPERFATDLQALVKLARKYSDKMLFVGLTPVEIESPYVRGSWTVARICEFEDVLRTFAKKEAIPLVALLEEFGALLEEEELLTDGFHPNDDGHLFIYDQVKPVLANLLRPSKKRIAILHA